MEKDISYNWILIYRETADKTAALSLDSQTLCN